ncbi:hypothetical protein JCM16303_000692 [Sporobolomyces ruberrimus]
MDLANLSASLPSEAPAASAPASSFRLDPQCLERRLPAKLGQDTLAARRLLRAAKGRPPMVRRRSRSLDDESRTTAEPGPFRIDPTPYLDSRTTRPSMSSRTPFSASSFSSDCTTVPSSAISSSCATTAPSPYIACPLTPYSSHDGFASGGFCVPPPITRSFSDTALDLPFTMMEPLFPLAAADLPQSRSSRSLTKSYSAADNRLASWIKVTSSPFTETPLLPPLAESPAPSLHQPVRHSFTPVLPSPLSESYISAGEDGFPFPTTPVLPSSFTTAPTESLIASSSRSCASESASPDSSVRSAPVASPMIARKHTRAHTFASTSTPNPRSSPYRSTTLPSPTAGVTPPAPFALEHRRSVPLTPPDSLCTAPFLANASASELAWHDVLGSRRDSTALPTVAQAQISLIRGEGKGKETPRFSSSTPEQEEAARKSGGGGNSNELMSTVGGGHFATATKERLTQLIEEHIGEVPLEKDDSLVQIVEYGAIHSKSSALVQPILSHFAQRHVALVASPNTLAPEVQSFEDDNELSFSVLHTDKTGSDFRNLAQALDASIPPSSSYLHADPALDGRVFSTFSARPFGSKVVAKGSVSVGFSAMSLHWPSTDRKYRVAPATLAHGELMAFLSARAFEFKAGGLLTMAYIGRSEEYANAASPGYSPYSSSPSTPSTSPTEATAGTKSPAPVQPRKRDIWAVLTSVLGKAIQRLVSTGLLKPQVARQLLALPLHPRTPRQTLACVRASSHSWELLHSSLLTLSHPAWQGVTHGTVSPESWADYTIQLLKIFWESEIRAVLKDALGSRGACEWVLDCLWTVAKEKVEEDPPHPLELEIQLLALRRRTNRSSSTPPSPTMP